MKNGAITAFVSGALISAIALGWTYAGRAPDAPHESPPQGDLAQPSVTAVPSPTGQAAPSPPDTPGPVAGQAECTERPRDLESTRGQPLAERGQIGSVLLGRIDPACWSWEGDRRAAGEGDVDAAAAPLTPRTPESEADAASPTPPSAAGPAISASPATPQPPIEEALRPSISPSAPVAMRPAVRPRVFYPTLDSRTRAAGRPANVRTGTPVRACSRTIVRARY